MKYLRLVKSESELVDPQLDKSSVYFAKADKVVKLFKQAVSFILGNSKLGSGRLG